jgi:alkanesulfonate monooxygenase SsuD/methylene tetrahydromethanopterin reductase-like flavin-dependent oxidoreductase (luciferase family)
MHIGMFMEFGFRNGGSARDAFRDGFKLVDAGESWGLDSAWLAEFHFMPDRSVLSSPIVLAGAIAARTKRMRIGTAVYVLPLTNPLRVAEEVATLDQISGGRLDFGIGRSGFARQYKIYDIDYGESQARFAEAVAVLRLAWKGERFSYDGVYFQVRDALVVPEPVQKPHPPMRIAAASPGTYISAAEQGVPLFVGLRGDGLESLKHNIATPGARPAMTAMAASICGFPSMPRRARERRARNPAPTSNIISNARPGWSPRPPSCTPRVPLANGRRPVWRR